MKNNIFIISLKKNILSILFFLFTVCLILFSKSNLQAAKNGLNLWANSVVPSLLPFFIATELLSYTNIIQILGKYLKYIMRPLFNVPGEGAYAFIMGIISGYPVGAKIVANLKENKICTKEECERLISFTNNSGPLFIIGTVGISFFGNTQIGFLLFISHIISCISVGFCFRFWKKKKTGGDFCDFWDVSKKHVLDTSQKLPKLPSASNLGEILSSSISNAINTVVIIGGFVVLFSVITSILYSSNAIEILSNLFYFLFKIPVNISSSFISGIIEITNGLKSISNINIKSFSTLIILSSFILGFGGISIILQVLSITSKVSLSIKPYILGKFLQGCFSSFYTFIFIHTFPMFNLDLKPVFVNLSSSSQIYFNYNFLGYGFLFISILVLLIYYRKIKAPN